MLAVVILQNRTDEMLKGSRYLGNKKSNVALESNNLKVVIP